MTAIDVLDPDKRVLDHSRMGEILVDNALDRQNSPPILAPVIQNANPVVAAPDNEIVKEGLNRRDLFICVHEQFMTEAAAIANVALLATIFLEHDDFYQSGIPIYRLTGNALNSMTMPQ